MCLINLHTLTLFVLISLSSVGFANDDYTKDFEQFLAKQEKASEAAKQKLLRAIENVVKEVRRSNLEPGEKQIQLDAIERDRTALANGDKLPSSDVLLGAVVEIVADYQKVIKNLESFRQHNSDRSVRKSGGVAVTKVTALEERLNKIVGGREQFTSGSSWSGKFDKHGFGPRGKRSKDVSFEMRLEVAEVSGNTFHGTLKQIGAAARPATMDVVGVLDGNTITFHTTDVTRGKDRSYGFAGYLLSDRIASKVDGADLGGIPASGWVSLWHDGESGAKKRRRAKAAAR